jgi:ABC-2 type transport system permease protein
MTLLAVERIKLFTTRSPWWCMVLALGLTVGFALLVSANANDNFPATVEASQDGSQFGLIVMMVMAALAVTTEYRFGTIRASFQAVPNRSAVLLAKAGVVTLVAGIVGEVTAFASWALVHLMHPGALTALNSGANWRHVAGSGLVYAFAALIALSVGILVRQTAGAVAILLVWVLLAENLISLVPKVGDKIQHWLPFTEANYFLTAGASAAETHSAEGVTMPLSAWGSLAYFAGIAVVLFGIAVATANRRDA